MVLNLNCKYKRFNNLFYYLFFLFMKAHYKLQNFTLFYMFIDELEIHF